MRAFPVLLTLFIIVPLVEIYLFIKVGSLIGALATVALVIITALAGVSLLRIQGFQTMAKFQQQMVNGELPADTMVEGMALLFGGVLLLTPGFLTDAIGFLCLIPLTRRVVVRWLMQNFFLQSRFSGHGFSTHPDQKSNVLEGEYRRKKDE